MEISELLREGRNIWGREKLTLEEIIIRLSVVMGDVSRFARNQQEALPIDDAELKKELGNVIFSVIRWCDDLGYSPEECIELAKQAQLAYVRKQRQNSPSSKSSTPNRS